MGFKGVPIWIWLVKTMAYNLTIASMGLNGVPGWIWLGRTKTYNLEFLVGFGWERL